jgi:hypothetical protein
LCSGKEKCPGEKEKNPSRDELPLKVNVIRRFTTAHTLLAEGGREGGRERKGRDGRFTGDVEGEARRGRKGCFPTREGQNGRN